MPSYADLLNAGRSVSAPIKSRAPPDENAMDWVSSQAQAEEIVATINAGRQEWTYEAMDIDSFDEEEANAAEPLTSLSEKSLLAVLDTNFLINHVDLLDDLVDFLSSAALTLRPPPCVLCIPRIVLHELDKLKLSDRMIDQPLPPTDPGASGSSRHAVAEVPKRKARISLSSVVRQIASWLVDTMRSRKLVVRGQRKEETLLPPQARVPADDRVLDAASYFQSRKSEAALVTADKILTAKALADDIRVVTPKPATDLRTMLAAMHPDLLTIYMREEHHRRIVPVRRASEPTVPQHLVVPNGIHPSNMSVSGDSASMMELDADLLVDEPSEMHIPLLDPALTGIALAYAEMQLHVAQLLVTALQKLDIDGNISTTASVVSCLDVIEAKWDHLFTATTPLARRASSPSISLDGSTRSRWAPAGSKGGHPTLGQETEANAARLRSARQTTLALRATLAKCPPEGVRRWSKGRFEALLDDVKCLLELLEERGGLEAGVTEEHIAILTAELRAAL